MNWKINYGWVVVDGVFKKDRHMKRKLKMIWRILRDRQVVLITEDHGRMYYDWDTRSLEDVCQMCLKIYDMAYMLNHKK